MHDPAVKSEQVSSPVSLREAFRYWLKPGLISFGGTAGKISMMHQERVERPRWISGHRFPSLAQLPMVLPGLKEQQLATYIVKCPDISSVIVAFALAGLATRFGDSQPAHKYKTVTGASMELKQGFERAVRWFGFLFIFVVTNYVCAMLLLQSGEPPFFHSYETTAAVVMRSYVEESRFATADGYEGSRWCPRIEFQYAVNGQLFISHRYQPIVHCKSRQNAERLIANFPPGHRIQVWYSTDDPGYAVIDKSIQPLVFLYYGGILFAWLMGNLFAFGSLRKTATSSGRD